MRWKRGWNLIIRESTSLYTVYLNSKYHSTCAVSPWQHSSGTLVNLNSLLCPWRLPLCLWTMLVCSCNRVLQFWHQCAMCIGALFTILQMACCKSLCCLIAVLLAKILETFGSWWKHLQTRMETLCLKVCLQLCLRRYKKCESTTRSFQQR